MLGPYSKLMQALPQISDDEYYEARANDRYIICRCCGDEITGRWEWENSLCLKVRLEDSNKTCLQLWQGSYRRYLHRDYKNWVYRRKQRREEKRWLKISKKLLKEVRQLIKPLVV